MVPYDLSRGEVQGSERGPLEFRRRLLWASRISQLGGRYIDFRKYHRCYGYRIFIFPYFYLRIQFPEIVHSSST